jgi:hypothetical protein
MPCGFGQEKSPDNTLANPAGTVAPVIPIFRKKDGKTP